MRVVVVRGGGDLATGVVQKLHRAGYGVIVLETDAPTAIRRGVALSEAVYCGTVTVEDVTARKTEFSAEAVHNAIAEGIIPLLVDSKCKCLEFLKPFAVVDAIIAKKNLGTHREMADLTIGLGPGFSAPDDVTVVIETMRGHNLGRLIFNGCAQQNTSLPAEIGGVSGDRVIYAPADGKIRLVRDIGDLVKKGELIAYIGNVPIRTKIGGLLRGILRDGFDAKCGLKMADVDPRECEKDNCFTISDKARALGGAVLEAVVAYNRRREL